LSNQSDTPRSGGTLPARAHGRAARWLIPASGCPTLPITAAAWLADLPVHRSPAGGASHSWRPPRYASFWLFASIASRSCRASSLMWTAPEVASAICSARTRPVAPLVSAVSPVRIPLVARPPGVLRHNRAAPARHRVLPPSHCLRGWKVGCSATPETGPAGPPASEPRQPTVAVDCADRQAGGIGQPTDGFVGVAATVALRRAL
jgi:hypothetical protein